MAGDELDIERPKYILDIIGDKFLSVGNIWKNSFVHQVKKDE